MSTKLTAFGPAFIGNNYTAGDQTSPSVARVNGDSFYITYLDQSTGQIRQTAYNANGTPSTVLGDHAISGTGLVNPNSFGLQPKGSNQGKEMVYWFQADPANAGKYFVMAQIYNPDGTADGSAFQINQTSETLDTSRKITFTTTNNFALNDAGEILFTWTYKTDSTHETVMARVFDANFNPVSAEFQVNTTSGGLAEFGTPTGLANGNFAEIFATNDGPGGTFNIRERVFDQAGNPVSINGSTDDFIINSTATSLASFPGYNRANLGNGDSVIAWASNDQGGGDASGTSIRYLLLDSNGVPIGSDAVADTTTTGNQSSPILRELPNGQVVFVWESFETGTLTFRSRIMNKNGTWASSSDAVLATTSDTSAISYAFSTLSDGRIVLDWQGTDGSGKGIAAQVFIPTVATDDVVTLTTPGTATGTSSTANWLVGANTGVNTLIGGAGKNYLFGGSDGNTFVAGAGVNQMIGGGGNNTFQFTSSANTSSATIAGGPLAVAGSAAAGTVNTIELDPTDNSTFDFTTATITDITNVSFAGAKLPGDPSVKFLSNQIGAGMLATDATFTFDANLDNITIVDATPGVATTIDTSNFSFINLDPGLDSLTFDLSSATADTTAIAPNTGIPTTFLVGGGNETLVGSTGADTASFNMTMSQATITHNADGTTTIATASGTDTLSKIEVAKFTDGQVSLQLPARSDFNSDGTSDVLLQNGGTVVDWLMQNGLYSTGNVLTTGATGYTNVGTGDFNGDGTADNLLQNGGTVVDWILQNGTYQSGNVITTAATGYTVVGTGDFNADGTSDVLLQNGGTVVDWIMQSGLYQSGNVVTTGATGYTVVGTGDFNGDGTSDVLLQNGGTVVDWIMQNGTYQSGNVITTGATGFKVVGTGDFDGDGTTDVLLQNGGTVVDWIMKNGQYQSGNVLTTAATGFTVVGTGDYNGDGTSDVLLQNGGTVVDWIMKNGAYQSGNVITTAATGFTVSPS